MISPLSLAFMLGSTAWINLSAPKTLTSNSSLVTLMGTHSSADITRVPALLTVNLKRKKLANGLRWGSQLIHSFTGDGTLQLHAFISIASKNIFPKPIGLANLRVSVKKSYFHFSSIVTDIPIQESIFFPKTRKKNSPLMIHISRKSEQ